MGIRGELIALIDALSVLDPPPVRRVYVPDPMPAPDRNAEFGLVELADGSAGLYYAWLGESQRGMAARFTRRALEGMDACALARWYAEDGEAARSLGLASLNALTAHCWRRAGYEPPAAAGAFGGLVLRAGDHLGMVGHFPSLVRQAGAAGARVTVLERKAHMVQEASGLSVTLDPARLAGCDKLLVTGATLINDTLDGVLERAQAVPGIVVVGPTVGCFPDPLFARGVARVGGTCILDSARALDRLRTGEKLGDAARRYIIDAAAYPGFEALMERAG